MFCAMILKREEEFDKTGFVVESAALLVSGTQKIRDNSSMSQLCLSARTSMYSFVSLVWPSFATTFISVLLSTIASSFIVRIYNSFIKSLTINL